MICTNKKSYHPIQILKCDKQKQVDYITSNKVDNIIKPCKVKNIFIENNQNNNITLAEVLNNGNIASTDIDMSENNIENVSGIIFSDNTYLGIGNSFDICSNETIKFNNDKLVIDICGNVGIGTINPQKTFDVSGDVVICGELSVEGNVIIKDEMDVIGNIDTCGNLVVAQKITGNSLNILGDVSMNGDVDICGNTTIYGNLSVEGKVIKKDEMEVIGNIDTCGNLVVAQKITGNSLNILGNSNFNQNVSMNGNVDIRGSLLVNNNNITNIFNNKSSIATGDTHSLVVLDDGSVKAFGSNSNGQLGIGTSDTSSNIPVDVSGITNAIAVAGGLNHSLVLLNDGSVKAFGSNSNGQLGNGKSGGFMKEESPVDVSGITNANAIDAGNSYSLVLLDDGKVKGFGTNGAGQLGIGSTQGTIDSPTDVLGITNAVGVATGRSHSLVVLADGKVKAFGVNFYGQLGNGKSGSGQNQISPVEVSGITNAVAVSAGNDHSLVLLNDGSVKAFGDNRFGQLGNGTSDSSSNIPVTVSGITNAIAISAGRIHSLVLLSNGTVKAFGNNGSGQLGTGTTNPSISPVDVSGITNAVAISAGGSHSLVMLSDGTVKSFGLNTEGQLGIGTSDTSSNNPVDVSNISTAKKQSIFFNAQSTIRSIQELNNKITNLENIIERQQQQINLLLER
jgi:alpha-tubulin suppressor-like RCC1 family protein